MRVLDRSFFRKTVPLSAATILENKHITNIRNELASSNDLLNAPRVMAVRVAQEEGLWQRESLGAARMVGTGGDVRRKCVLLREGLKFDGIGIPLFVDSFGGWPSLSHAFR